ATHLLERRSTAARQGFGVISTTAIPMRQLQMALKYSDVWTERMDDDNCAGQRLTSGDGRPFVKGISGLLLQIPASADSRCDPVMSVAGQRSRWLLALCRVPDSIEPSPRIPRPSDKPRLPSPARTSRVGLFSNR